MILEEIRLTGNPNPTYYIRYVIKKEIMNDNIYFFKGICISRPPALCLAPGPSPCPQFVFTDVAPNLYLTALAPNSYLTTLAPNLYLPALAPNFYLPALVSPKPGLAGTNHVPPICIYWPWSTIFITVL